MNESLNKRKADVRRYLDEQFEDRPRRWWEYKANDYIPTRDMGGGKNYPPHYPEETIVTFDLKRALISSALFFIISLSFCAIGNYEEHTASFRTMACYIIIVMLFQLVHGIKRKKRPMIFNRNGFRISTMPGLVPWDHLAASYIRKENSGEDPGYYLLMYYYHEAKDEFEEIEESIAGLDMSKEDIASQIEYWKMISGTNTIKG